MSQQIPPSKPFDNPQDAVFTSNAWFEIGKSAGGRSIQARRFSGGAKRIMLIGGVHGNETEGVRFMVDFCREIEQAEKKATGGLKKIGMYKIEDYSFYLMPVMNPDGFFGFKRQNDNQVDLNRNMPTKDFTTDIKEEKYFPGNEAGSEPETQALLQALEEFKPQYIISFHSWKPMINLNGPARPFGKVMYKKLPYELTEDIGYPTPGSLGTWAGWERKIPTITLEFERGLDLDSIYPKARDAIFDSFSVL